MKRYVLAILILGIFAVQGFAQENPAPTDQAQAPVAIEAVTPAPAEKAVQPQEISIYGEVKTVNAATNSVMIQYYDYDSDEEKTIEVIADKDTKMENAAAVADIKQGNWADVIYSVSGGKNMAKSIVIEKEEETPPVVETPAAETKPQEEVKQ